MTDNPNRIPFKDMPHEDQDRIAGAFLRGEPVQGSWLEGWQETDLHGFFPEGVYRIPPAAKPETSVVNITFENVNITPYFEDRDFITYGGEYSNVGDMIKRHYEVITPKPAKDPNRPRPAHKLNLQKGDVVRLVKWQDGYTCMIGSKFTCGDSGAVRSQIDTPSPKGHRPLFVVVSRADSSS